MKKSMIFTFLAIGLMAVGFSPANAQSFSISPYAGTCLDQKGLVTMNPVIGATSLVGIAGDRFSFGLEMNGSQWYNCPATIKTADLQRDSATLQPINAPAILLVGSINIPPGEGDSPNHFAGPIFMFGYGQAFLGSSHIAANNLKISLQGNYGGKVGKYKLGGFVRASFNALYATSTVYNWNVAVGINFTIPNAFSGSSAVSDY